LNFAYGVGGGGSPPFGEKNGGSPRIVVPGLFGNFSGKGKIPGSLTSLGDSRMHRKGLRQVKRDGWGSDILCWIDSGGGGERGRAWGCCVKREENQGPGDRSVGTCGGRNRKQESSFGRSSGGKLGGQYLVV